jgi:hypothetical protein
LPSAISFFACSNARSFSVTAIGSSSGLDF